ncbi:MAG: hypothetical protein FJW20_18055 [Acidimicrobiia bacterium]|nr:hypothetical protein [Acidimicrobiia bacterium]
MSNVTFPTLGVILLTATAFAQQAPPPAGTPPILRASEVKAGMQGTAWTVFAGSEPEPVPIEIIGLMKNAWGPKQDIILAKMGGKAQRTNVAGGMSGSPVYIDGKLIGAIAVRLSIFSPDAICGITPIELMLEINDFDTSRPAEARSPGEPARKASIPAQEGLSPALNSGVTLTPIESPVVFSGFHPAAFETLAPMLQQAGMMPVQGGAAATHLSSKPVPGWEKALRPGEAVSGILVSGDMSMTVMGTVTHNDGKRVLAFGHPFLNLGPVAMPMARSEVLMTLASSFQPNKIGNAAEIVGALKQDRHSGVMGVLGEQAGMIPCRLRVRTFGDGDSIQKEKELRFQVFVQQKWTPFLMMATLFNAISGLNDFAEESTYRISGQVEMEGNQTISLATMFAPAETPIPVPIQMAGWWGEKFNRLFHNPVQQPRLKSVDVSLDLLPQRRIATIQNAWVASNEMEPGEEVTVKVFLRPYRGGRVEEDVRIKIPAGFPKGDHRILVSDAETLNRMQNVAGQVSRFMDLPETVSLINQERTNNKLYVSLVQARPTVYHEDKTLPSLPGSVANVMQNGRTGNRPFLIAPETAVEQMAVPFDRQVSGSYSLRIKVN